MNAATIRNSFRRIQDAVEDAKAKYTDDKLDAVFDDLVEFEIAKEHTGIGKFWDLQVEDYAMFKAKRNDTYQQYEDFINPSFSVNGKRVYLKDLNAL